MSKYDLTISVPSIKPRFWNRLLSTIPQSIGKYSYEVLFVGPEEPLEPLPKNCKFIKNLATPTRCVHESALEAEGVLFTWASDDGLFMQDGLKEAISFWDLDRGSDNDEVVMRYFEGPNFTGSYHGHMLDGPRQSYWHAHHHPDLTLPYIPYNYKVACLGLLSLETFKDFGGFDCRFEHINMSPIDLSVRLQHAGAGVYLSPLPVLNCDFETTHNSSDRAPIVASFQHDAALFRQLHSNPGREHRLDFNNYKDSPEIWRRRFA